MAELIALCTNQLEDRKAILATLRKTEVRLSNLTSLFLSMMLRFPEIGELAAKLRKQEFEMWKRAVINSIRLRQVRDDVDADAIATLFLGVKDACEAECFGRAFPAGHNMRSFGYLYELIKVKE
ncbi:MAG: hypothetical protein NC038_02465 [Paludibacter sp.]|nr:hypothetical protein [Bacteroidales bacterium]MCM1068943.1 hypothetical protein [Prevotella sp.]MCM1353606.1 hypothetical protein [Bacteroides sp.]MCM1442045.1 hypothetical protein [Muribaculum sp.]MCM1481499.1 hypothetical protein [Paludibacter sp.]